MYPFFIFRNMLKVSTALNSPVAHIDDITRPITIYNDTYKYVAYPYSILQEFIVDNKVMVTSHPEAVKKLHAWRTYFDKGFAEECFHYLQAEYPIGPWYRPSFQRR